MKAKILLADDDASVLQMLGRVLVSESYTVSLAQDGWEAAVMFLSAPPDLVLLDLNMPVKDGWESFHLMHAVNPQIPVIVITARSGQQAPAKRLGTHALLEKPLNLPQLLETIRNALAETMEQRALRLGNPDFQTPRESLK